MITSDQLTRFYEALHNQVARSFFFRTITDQIINAIPAFSSDPSILSETDIAKKTHVFVDRLLELVDLTQASPETLLDHLITLGFWHSPRHSIWFSSYVDALKNSFARDDMYRSNLLFPYLKGTSLVDIGCGSGRLTTYFRDSYRSSLRRVAGIDVHNFLSPGSDLEFYEADFSLPGQSVSQKFDTGLLLHVLHHVGAEDQTVSTFLKGVRSVVTNRLLVVEDIQISTEDLAIPLPGIEALLRRVTHEPILGRYSALDRHTQKDVLALFDVICNPLYFAAKEMEFPFGYRSISGWKQRFESNGFGLKEVYVYGFQPDRFYESCYALFVLDVK